MDLLFHYPIHVRVCWVLCQTYPEYPSTSYENIRGKYVTRLLNQSYGDLCVRQTIGVPDYDSTPPTSESTLEEVEKVTGKSL